MVSPRVLRWNVRARLDPYGRPAFLQRLPRGARILDVGCGNRSASFAKRLRPDLRYTGIDVGDYNLADEDKQLMESYIVCSPERFAAGIRAFGAVFDGVLSSHNLEHCDEPDDVVAAMQSVVRPGGLLYLAFPSEASLGFPSRGGCLNFRDDPTHRAVPPFDGVMATIRTGGFEVIRSARRNRGAAGIPAVLGWLQEPWSRARNRVSSFTWYAWGFESVIVARRP